jgi:tyrosine N-monooxygenase
VMRTLSRLHDPIIRERIREWDGLRERGEKREVRDFLDALVSLVDSQGRPLLSFDEIKAQTAVRSDMHLKELSCMCFALFIII